MDTDGERRNKTIGCEMMVLTPFAQAMPEYLFSQWQCGECGSPFTDKWEAEECCSHMEVVK
jgi:hypothetical protein